MNPSLSSIKPFYDKLLNHQNDRYRSFNHCYSYFKNMDNEYIDETVSMLHLGFYLASWGMYRGSSFLIQKDYKIFKPVIQKLFENQYLDLKNLDEKLNKNNYKEMAALTFSLHEKIQEILETERLKYYEYKNKNSPKAKISSTLTTKILMGTLGCIPAYDRFFQSGIKAYNDNNKPNLIQNFSVNSINKIYHFAVKNKDDLLNIQSELIEETGYKYPLMKLIDSYFWLIGYNLELKFL